MAETMQDERPQPLDVVALLANIPAADLARGQVGTIVELLDDETVLVEFSDHDGRTYALEPCRYRDLLVLRYVPKRLGSHMRPELGEDSTEPGPPTLKDLLLAEVPRPVISAPRRGRLQRRRSVRLDD
jgi:hypothetical protein